MTFHLRTFGTPARFSDDGRNYDPATDAGKILAAQTYAANACHCIHARQSAQRSPANMLHLHEIKPSDNFFIGASIADKNAGLAQ